MGCNNFFYCVEEPEAWYQASVELPDQNPILPLPTLVLQPFYLLNRLLMQTGDHIHTKS